MTSEDLTEKIRKEVDPKVLERLYNFINDEANDFHDYTIGQIIELVEFLKHFEKNRYVAELIEDIKNKGIDAEDFTELFYDWPIFRP